MSDFDYKAQPQYNRDVLLKTFRRNRLLTAVAIVCLSLGIGATTAVFSVVDGVLFRALPYPDADRLVLLRTMKFEDHPDRGRVSAPELRDWQAEAKSFEAIAGYRFFGIDLIDSDRSERLHGLWVTPEFLSVFKINPVFGRSFNLTDPPQSLILGRSLWERRFAMDRSIVGGAIPLGICCPQQPRTVSGPVVGVMDADIPFPPTLKHLRDPGHTANDFIEYWSPLDLSRAKRPGGRELEAIAKLRPGVSAEEAQAEMTGIAGRLEKFYPDENKGWTIRVVPIAEELFADVRPALLLLMGAASFVLLIACANVAVLLTFSALRRSLEIAVKATLGASAGRLAREIIAESVLLTACGGAVGLILAIAFKQLLISFAPQTLLRATSISLDLRMTAFALGVTVICGVVIGLIPAFRILKSDLDSRLRSGNARTSTSRGRARTYEPLLAAQVALTLTLLIGSGLMIKGLTRLFTVSTGFDSTNLMTVTVSLPYAKHAWNYNARFSELVVEKIEQVPGVEAVGAIRGIPLNEARFEGMFRRADQTPDQSRLIRIRVVSRGYFRAMRIPVVAGRTFVPQDGIGEVGLTDVVIINEALARLFWPGQNAVGQRFGGASRDTAEVIGVVGDARYTSMNTEPIPEVYFPEGLFPQDEIGLAIRTSSASAGLTTAIRDAIHKVQRDVLIGTFRTMDEVIAASVADRRFMMMVLTGFAGSGLLLAIAGIAGIVAYSLSLRLREVGVRMAVGATPRDVILLLSRQGLGPAFAGLGAGLLIARGVTRLLSSMLYNVSPFDGVVFLWSTVALALVACMAAGLTAYRACRVDASSILK